MLTLRLKNGHDHRARQGHLWIFSNELDHDVASLPPGAAVELRDSRGGFIGRGYANPRSLISVRLLSHSPDADPDGVALYRDALLKARAYRQRVLPGRRSMRWIAAEADGLPGLVIDGYEDVLAVQVSTLGLEFRLELLQQAIAEVFAPRGAVLRNDSGARELEGLERYRRLWFGEVAAQTPFEENGVKLVADVLDGQKTGFFFDQADNRAYATRLAAGARVLDVYANTGAWALGALRHGAVSATTIEVNRETCALIEESARRNDVAERLTVVCQDAREAMDALRAKGARFDAVYLDPPAFAKTKKKAAVALKAYRDVNQQAMDLLPPGGLLFTSSCSHHVQEDRFLEAVLDAARRARRTLRMFRRGEQAPDHPVNPLLPETRYLKHLAFEVS